MAAFRLKNLFTEFFESERSGGLVLVFCTFVSILIANSPWGPAWFQFWHTHHDLSFGPVPLDHSVEQWVNDGLMAIFFLLVGLEIKREIYVGELTDPRKALLPIVAAVGGMVVPASIHFLFNHGRPEQAGIGIPMATDIAFALGVLSLLGNKIPASVKIFLTALAIIDDLGAIVVIAFFYTKTLALGWLVAALIILLVLIVFNRLKINNLLFYTLPAVLLWYCMLRSGIHATLSGVMLAFVIPFPRPGSGSANSSERLQHLLHKPVAFLILPVFALANTGVPLAAGWPGTLLSTNSLGILFGLVLGKPIGVLFCCWLSIRARWCRLPEEMQNRHLLGASLLAGIGFTMSIFITNLAFDAPQLVQHSKIAILVASLLASGSGYVVLAANKKLVTYVYN